MTKNSDAEAIRSMLARYDPAADVSPGYHSIAAAEQITRQPGVPGGPERDTEGTRGDRSTANPGNRTRHLCREAGRLRPTAAAPRAAAPVAEPGNARLTGFSAWPHPATAA